MSAPSSVWQLPRGIWGPQSLPRLMGILNVTPDSFSDGGSYVTLEAALQQARKLEDEGADVLDVGGESTRPGALPVPSQEELKRVVPVVEALAAQAKCPVSIDTTKAAVARAAIRAGASIVNDVSGLTFDPEMVRVCAETGAAVVVMHIQGTPQTMQQAPHYVSVVDELLTYFEERLKTLAAAGIPPERIALDPGIGFGKTARHNLEILSSIARFKSLGRPVLIGHSRKRFVKTLIGKSLDEHFAGTVGVSLALAEQGVDLLRLHDVAANRDALLAWHAVRSAVPPG